jgi:hypothetical protein
MFLRGCGGFGFQHPQFLVHCAAIDVFRRHGGADVAEDIQKVRPTPPTLGLHPFTDPSELLGEAVQVGDSCRRQRPTATAALAGGAAVAMVGNPHLSASQVSIQQVGQMGVTGAGAIRA